MKLSFSKLIKTANTILVCLIMTLFLVYELEAVTIL